MKHVRRRGLREPPKVKGLFPELVHYIAQAFPGHHVDKGISHLICHIPTRIRRLDIGQRLWKVTGRRPRHPVIDGQHSQDQQ